jgi:predicted N-acetyltransferase YhbS
MRINFRQADFDALAEVWNNFYPAEYQIDAALLKQNTVDSPTFDWGASLIEVMDDRVMGFVAVKQSTARLYPGWPQDTAHLSAIAYAESDTAVDLLAEVKGILTNRGTHRVVFGMDSRHFFPGCPVTTHALCDLLLVEGFQNGEPCYDVERDLTNYEAPFPISEAATYRSIQKEDQQALEELLKDQFSRRWHYDVLNKIEAEGRADFVIGAFDGEECIGFAMTQDSSHKLTISGAVWHADLGDNWGALGPIGVTEGRRGEGIGHGLLSSALLDLKGRNVHRCIIDWTVLTDFYGKHGFEPTRTYYFKALTLGD